jgi:hypothetical protein
VVAPAPAAPAAAPESKAVPAKRKLPAIKKRVEFNPPATAVVKKSNVNVRGQPSFVGETLGHLQKGDSVTVTEELTIAHRAADEPAQWARIVMPTNIHVWVSAEHVDKDAKVVKARRVNLRGGPGENFSIVGRLEKGAPITEVKSEKGWLAIECPTNAYAYVATEFLDIQPAPAAIAAAPPTAPPPAPGSEIVNVTPAAPAVAATNEPVVATPPAAAMAPPVQPVEPPKETPAVTNAPVTAAAPEVMTPRIITREGFVRRSYNIQAPADFELHDIQTGEIIDYLRPKPGQNFKIFVGTRVRITGEEGLAPRWPRTPVLQVENVDLLP